MYKSTSRSLPNSLHTSISFFSNTLFNISNSTGSYIDILSLTSTLPVCMRNRKHFSTLNVYASSY